MPVWLGGIEMAKIISYRYIRLDFYDVLNNKNETHKAILLVDKIEDKPVISAVFLEETKGLMLVITRDQAQELVSALNDVLSGKETLQ